MCRYSLWNWVFNIRAVYVYRVYLMRKCYIGLGSSLVLLNLIYIEYCLVEWYFRVNKYLDDNIFEY